MERELIVLVAACDTAAAQTTTPFTSIGIDYITIQVTNRAPSIAFYESIFGLSILNQDEPNKIVRTGVDRLIGSLHEKPRPLRDLDR